ncbi:MAG: aldolase, partial [Undibacterium sp.]|nr:aldolase [Opitutaceae bacterium]
MKTRVSRVLKLLREGQLPTTLKINLSDPRVIEIAGLSGVDAVWLCTEHVPNDWLSLENQIRAARVHNIDTLVRVGRGSYSDYIRPFEAD